jgi:hypothetical protein
MATEWYVFREPEPLGPLTAADLKSMAAEGAIFPSSLVSVDRKVWREAGAVRGLEFAATSARPARPASRLWIGLAALGVPVGFVVGFALFIFLFTSASDSVRQEERIGLAGGTLGILGSVGFCLWRFFRSAPASPRHLTQASGEQRFAGPAVKRNLGRRAAAAKALWSRLTLRQRVGVGMGVAAVLCLLSFALWPHRHHEWGGGNGATIGSNRTALSKEEASGFTLVQVSPTHFMVMRDEEWDATNEANLSDRERAEMLWLLRGRGLTNMPTIPAPIELRRPVGWSQRLTKAQFAKMTSG